MDLESVFDGPLSTSSGEKMGKGVSVSVWQAEVALRLSESKKVFIAIELMFIHACVLFSTV